MFTLILAGNTQEAMTFSRDVGLTRPRIATSAESIRGLRVTNIIELPSFWRRPDKHAILAEVRTMLRQNRRATHVLYEEWVHPKDRPVEGQMTIDDALSDAPPSPPPPPVVGDVIQTTGTGTRVEIHDLPAGIAPKPTSVSAVKAARRQRRATS